MPPELAEQMPTLKQLLKYLGYATVECEGYEADDILGTLSANCRGSDRCFIATGDRDSLQLVSENTAVLLASTKAGKAQTVFYDAAAVEQTYGVPPRALIEIKALMGDSSDNIPGVAGVGEKTARELISRFSSIDSIYESLDTLDIREKLREKLLAGRESAFLSRRLGTICLEVPVSTDFDDYRIMPVDSYNALNTLAGLEMFGMIERLGLSGAASARTESPEKAERLPVREERDLCALLGRLKKEGRAYFYTLLDPDIRAVVFDMQGGMVFAASDCLDFESFLKGFFELDIEKYTCDTKRLYREALKRGIELRGVCMDTALAGYILNPSANAYDVPRLAAEYSVPVPETDADGALSDTAGCAAVLKPFCEKLEALIRENGQERLLYEIELPLARVLADMEQTGFLVDREGIDTFGKRLEREIYELSERIYEKTGEVFNLNSPKQLGEVLFTKLGIPGGKKTKTGWSTDAQTLEKLAYENPVISDILEYRTLAKLKSTYCDGLLKVIGDDGRIHSTLNQTETRTGRISSTEPNLQNIPVRTQLGRELRRFFIAQEGSVLCDADYSQIELRVLADIADDEIMRDAFNKELDIHSITASQVFNMPLEMVTPLMRSRAKAVNFGIVYGIGAFSLAQDIGVTRKQAESYINGYLEHYSGVNAYMHRVAQQARLTGYVETLFKRRRYLPELSSSNKMLQAFGERVARNMPIQGTAADIIKIAMIRVHGRLKSEGLRARLIMQVHDELIVETPRDEEQRVRQLLCEEMEGACKLSVKLRADAHSGVSWYEAK